jgi:hypothetical protein
MTGSGVIENGVAAAGLTLLGIKTGLEPAVLIAGFAGGVWAQSYGGPVVIWKRMFLTILSAILAGYLAPAVAAAAMSSASVREVFTVDMLRLPLAVVVGLVAHRVLGPAIMKLAAKKAGDFTK